MTAGPRGVPTRLLLRAEARRQSRDRSLRAATTLAAVASLALAVAVGTRTAPGDLRFAGLLGVALVPVSLLGPVVGALAVTTHWSRRTAALAFTHEPRRARVLAASLAVVTGTVLGLVLLAAVAAGVVVALRHYPGAPGWAPSAAVVLGAVGGEVLLVATGVAAGAVLRAPVPAVGAVVVLPLLAAAAHLAPALAPAAGWVDLERAVGPLAHGAVPTVPQWEHLAVAAAVWAVLPFAAGAARLTRQDVR